MWLILQHQIPDTFVLATGRTVTVREFVEMTAKILNINLQWRGEGIEEVGIDADTGKVIIKINPKFYRPAEVDILLGDPTKAKNLLGWMPDTSLEELCSIMVEADLGRNKLLLEK